MEKHSSVSIHLQNLQVLTTEIYKVRSELLTPIKKCIFSIQFYKQKPKIFQYIMQCVILSLM